jgi:hypothetical protein
MKKYTHWIGVMALLGAVSCSSLSEGGAGNMPPSPGQTQRIRYSGHNGNQLRRQMNEQSSEVNRKRNIEEFDHNAPVNLPPEVRPQQLPNAPVDSTRHRILRPLPTRKPINN